MHGDLGDNNLIQSEANFWMWFFGWGSDLCSMTKLMFESFSNRHQWWMALLISWSSQSSTSWLLIRWWQSLSIRKNNIIWVWKMLDATKVFSWSTANMFYWPVNCDCLSFLTIFRKYQRQHNSHLATTHVSCFWLNWYINSKNISIVRILMMVSLFTPNETY